MDSASSAIGCNELPFERYRPYLRLLAQAQLQRYVRGRVDASDIVQQTLLEAHRSRDRFTGDNSGQLAGWLRAIMAHVLGGVLRMHQRAKRTPNRERDLLADLDASNARLEQFLWADQSSPSQRAERHEDLVRLAGAIGEMPENYRDVLVLHHCQGWTLTSIAKHLDCSVPNVIQLLQRGTRKLKTLMEKPA